jgi:long-chain acyl-CoA synthetase
MALEVRPLTTLPELSRELLKNGGGVVGPQDGRDILETIETFRKRILLDAPPAPGLIAISLPLSVDHFAAILASWSLGYSTTLVSRRATEPEVAEIVRQSRPAMVIYAVPDGRFKSDHSIESEGVATRRYSPSGQEPLPLAPNDALVAFTSGSTGSPRGAVIGADAVLHNVTAVAEHLNLTHVDRILVFTPPHYTFANVQALSAIYAGATVLAWPYGTTSPKSLTLFSSAGRISGVSANPSAFEMWMRSPFQLPSLRYVLAAGQPTSHALAERLHGCFPSAQVIIGYGCTENVNRVTFLDAPSTAVVSDSNRVGYPIPGVTIEIAPDGEIVLFGASLMRGYLDALTSPADHIEKFCTGDLGTWNATTGLVLTGRKKTQVNVGNEMVSPEEVELAIGALAGIAECAAGGIPDPLLGEVIAVLCVLDPSADQDATALELGNAMAKSLSRSKRPARIYWSRNPSDIPRTEYGKIDRRRLVESLSRFGDISKP